MSARKGTNGELFLDDSIPQPEESVNSKYSLSEKTSDTAYLSAVERGDMETAQRMVDEESTGPTTVGTGAPDRPKEGEGAQKRTPRMEAFFW